MYLLAELERHYDIAAIFGPASVLESQLVLDMFGPVTCSPPKLRLTSSCCFNQ